MCQESKAHPMTNTHLLHAPFDYAEPASLVEAIALLVHHGERAQLMAGGTYLLVQMKQEHKQPEVIINVAGLPGLRGLTVRDGRPAIGALTTIRKVRELPGIATHYQALAEACGAFGSMQIQMMGTLGGNICNGSPASDAVPALLAYEAELVLAGPAGERMVPLSDFLLGPGQVALQPGEIVTQVVLAPPRPRSGGAFVKITRVAADLAKVSAAAVLAREGDRVVDCRLTFGSVAPTVIRAYGAEAVLRGRVFSPELALTAGEIAMSEVAPIDDVRSSAWYRRQVVRAVTHDVLLAAWQRAVEEGLTPLPEVKAAEAGEQMPAGVELTADERMLVELTVNGEEHQVWVAPNELLLNVLREKLELTGAKYGCGIGECGACTVLLNGRAVLGCLTLAVAADGCEVTTVEGLASPDGKLDPLQEAFLDHQAFQCGYCTPGVLMMSKALLNAMPQPGEDEVRAYLRGNRCRCTGFASIVRAVLSCVEA